MPLTQATVRMRAGGIEVTQDDMAQAMRRFIVLQQVFHRQLAVTVGVDRPGGMVLGNGDLLRIAEDGSGG